MHCATDRRTPCRGGEGHGGVRVSEASCRAHSAPINGTTLASRTHTHTYTRTHARTHACTHARTHANMHACTHARTHARTHAPCLRGSACPRPRAPRRSHRHADPGAKPPGARPPAGRTGAACMHACMHAWRGLGVFVLDACVYACIQRTQGGCRRAHWGTCLLVPCPHVEHTHPPSAPSAARPWTWPPAACAPRWQIPSPSRPQTRTGPCCHAAAVEVVTRVLLPWPWGPWRVSAPYPKKSCATHELDEALISAGLVDTGQERAGRRALLWRERWLPREERGVPAGGPAPQEQLHPPLQPCPTMRWRVSGAQGEVRCMHARVRTQGPPPCTRACTRARTHSTLHTSMHASMQHAHAHQHAPAPRRCRTRTLAHGWMLAPSPPPCRLWL